jgi:hypothetical protein
MSMPVVASPSPARMASARSLPSEESSTTAPPMLPSTAVRPASSNGADAGVIGVLPRPETPVPDEPTEGIRPLAAQRIERVGGLLRDRGDRAIRLVEPSCAFAEPWPTASR